jgi:hypothetical protein
MKTRFTTIIATLVLAGAAISASAHAQSAMTGNAYNDLSTPTGQSQFFERLQRDGG